MKTFRKILDTIIYKRHRLYLEEKDVINALRVIQNTCTSTVSCLIRNLSVGKDKLPSSYPQSQITVDTIANERWFIHFTCSNREWFLVRLQLLLHYIGESDKSIYCGLKEAAL